MPWTKKQLTRFIKEDTKELERTSGFCDWKFDKENGGFASVSFSKLAKGFGFPDIWIAGGGGVGTFYFVGFWCGKDNDLICIAPLTLKETNELDPYLSPEGRTPIEAIERAVAKRYETHKRKNKASY